MELLRYAPHLNIEKLQVKIFVYGINYSIKSKVWILIPHTLHEEVQRDIIVKEELVGGGQFRSLRPSSSRGRR
jgi:hypothetical protein